MKTYGPLYAKASNGKTKYWRIDIYEDGRMEMFHGYDGAKITKATRHAQPKNVGRSNETTAYEQACSEAQSKMNKKMDEGYFDTVRETNHQQIFLPMLAQKFTERKHKITYPCYVQPKLNGVRCIARMTEMGPEYLSRKGKLYTTLSHLNESVEDLTCRWEVPLDGEIFHPDWTFQEILRAVKKDRGDLTDELQYWVYDVVDVDSDFEDRIQKIQQFRLQNQVVYVPTHEVNSEEEIMEHHKKFTDQGFEGTIVRNKKGTYKLKHRSIDLQKYKTMLDREYIVTGVHEGTGTDEGTAVFELETPEGLKFSSRPKGSRETRAKYLENIQDIIGKEATIQYQELSEAPTGYTEGVPIFPIVLCIRDYE